MKFDDLARLIDANTILASLAWVVLISSLALQHIMPKDKAPLSILARVLGQELNRDVFDKISEIDKRISTLSDKVTLVAKLNEETRMIAARVRILRFGDELLNNQPHSKDSFDQAMIDVDTYTRYCKNNPDFQNGVAESMAEYIREQYNANLRNHGFANPKEGKKNES